MATSFIDFSTKHSVVESTKLAATTGGAHIYSIKVSADVDNGAIVGLGEYQAPEYYAEASASSTFAGKIIEKAANGSYRVQVTKCEPTDCILIQVPLIYEEYTTRMQDESNFYNAKNDIVRAYSLIIGDVFTISTEGFDGTPEVGKTVSVVNKKLKVAANA